MKKRITLIFFYVFTIIFFMAQVPASAQKVNNEIISITFLDQKCATISKTKTMNINGIDYKIGKPVIVSFENSEQGRKTLLENVPEDFASAVLAVWNEPSEINPMKKAEIDENSEVVEKIFIYSLNNKFVTFMKTTNTVIDGSERQLGEILAVSYENSIRGRKDLKQNISEPYYSAVMAVWGDEPTVVIKSEARH